MNRIFIIDAGYAWDRETYEEWWTVHVVAATSAQDAFALIDPPVDNEGVTIYALNEYTHLAGEITNFEEMGDELEDAVAPFLEFIKPPELKRHHSLKYKVLRWKADRTLDWWRWKNRWQRWRHRRWVAKQERLEK